ncbi:hypothetical protein NSK_004955 [Nannochloropsis salina CCMP1776]|uniref:Uncharacterized protein n=1 Tax=Nannochloropsis salina CCMP1776 TaxID=1027361 RepID=A0A4D9D5D2_9STRA|nr:hypothetical protein NSK_004955 [Nannochloropsis salina CCMP1776]|eukprot:TFJ83858.1 hypothetical protein NSK_004955 [Nannochloropsis salina CCMP1776]
MYAGTSFASSNPYVLGGYRASTTGSAGSSTSTGNPLSSQSADTSCPTSWQSQALPAPSSTPIDNRNHPSTSLSSTATSPSLTPIGAGLPRKLPPSSTPYGGVGPLSGAISQKKSTTCPSSLDGEECAAASTAGRFFPEPPSSSTASPKQSALPSPPQSYSVASCLTTAASSSYTPYTSGCATKVAPNTKAHGMRDGLDTCTSTDSIIAPSGGTCPSHAGTTTYLSDATSNRINSSHVRSHSHGQAAATRSPSSVSRGARRSSRPAKASNTIKVEVVETDMTPGADGPTYHIKLNMNGRSYMAKRHHNKLRSLVEGLRARGYRVWRPFPEVEDMMRQSPVKVENSLVEALPFYEGFGYSIKSLASTMLKSTSASHLRKKRSVQLEQMSQRIDAFLKTVFLENDDLEYEQEVYHFFWEPLQKKLPPVMEEDVSSDTENDTEEEEDVNSKTATRAPGMSSLHSI